MVYPAAGGLEVLLDLVREFESKGPACRQARQRSFKASYANHYRAGLIQILEALEFRSNNTVHRPVLEALELIKRHKAQHSPATLYSSLSQVEGWHAPAGRRTREPRPLAQARQIRPAAPVGAVNLGPGRQIVSQDSPDGVSRIGGQAGTQAPDPTPVSSQNRGSRAGSTIHSLPADSARGLVACPLGTRRPQNTQFWLPLGVLVAITCLGSSGRGSVRRCAMEEAGPEVSITGRFLGSVLTSRTPDSA